MSSPRKYTQGLLPDAEVVNPGAGIVWDKEERDRALDDYFAGGHPEQIGIKYKHAAKAFQNSILNKLRSNYRKEDSEDPRGRAEKYRPVRRVSRKGMRLTPNEIDFIKAHKERGIALEVTAKILCRDVDELNPDWKRKAHLKVAGVYAPTLDIILACRYARLKWAGEKLINDDTLAAMEAEEREYGGGGPTLDAKIKPENMPERISFLAVYLQARNNDLAREESLKKLQV